MHEEKLDKDQIKSILRTQLKITDESLKSSFLSGYNFYYDTGPNYFEITKTWDHSKKNFNGDYFLEGDRFSFTCLLIKDNECKEWEKYQGNSQKLKLVNLYRDTNTVINETSIKNYIKVFDDLDPSEIYKLLQIARLSIIDIMKNRHFSFNKESYNVFEDSYVFEQFIEEGNVDNIKPTSFARKYNNMNKNVDLVISYAFKSDGYKRSFQLIIKPYNKAIIQRGPIP